MSDKAILYDGAWVMREGGCRYEQVILERDGLLSITGDKYMCDGDPAPNLFPPPPIVQVLTPEQAADLGLHKGEISTGYSVNQTNRRRTWFD